MWRRKRRTDDDFAAEIRAHLEHETDRLIGEGMTPDEARAAAHREFGSPMRTRERFHETRRLIWVEQLAQDLRYAWRGLWQSRAFVATTVLTLAVGMGLVTVVFAVLNAYVLRPFAVHDPYSLYAIGWRSQEAGGSTYRWSDYEEFRARRDLFDGVVAEATRSVSSNGRRLAVGFVSGNYFDVLAPRVALGRGLVAGDARTPGGEPVAVLTHQAWSRLFDGDPAVVGREIQANGRALVVVGVVSPQFVGLDDSPRDMWVPITMYGAVAEEDLFGSNQPRQLRVTARLRRDVTPQRAQGSLAISPFETRVAGRVDAVRAELQLRATPTRVTREGLAVMAPVFAAFVLVLVAACANASNVMLARANARHREIGVRLAIGASRGRIVRQLLTEGLLIAMMAGLAGVALASALLRLGMFLFVTLLPPTVALRVRFVPLDFDYRVFLFAFVVAGTATILFALLPALQATRLTLTDALRGQPSGAVKSSTLRNLLVTGQVAVSLLLLIVAATVVRNGAAIRATDLGLNTTGVISIRQNGRDNALLRRAYDELTADPRVGQVVVTSRVPLFGEMPKTILQQPSGLVAASYTFVSPEFFATLGVPILRGRGFSADEARQEARVAVVSSAGAKALWPGEEPIGKTLRIFIEPPGDRVVVADVLKVLRKVGDESEAVLVTVIGVAKDVVSGFVYQGTDPAQLYFPTSVTGTRAAALMVRGGTTHVSADTLRTVLRPAHPDPLAFDVLAVDEMVALQMFPLRAASWIGSLLSAVALVLSVSGLYGVLTYTFGQRTHEIGIRIALGASAAAVRRLVAVESIRLASLGTAIGLLLGFSVMKMLSTVIRLDNVLVIDPGAFAIAVALIAGAVALASYAPARRATRVDPSSMLRADA
jgi:macrolide transport system ATP-binding/permease protein